MTQLLITAQEVLELAFSSTEQLREDLISDATISVAQRRYIKPILGPAFDTLGGEEYSGFVGMYIKPPLALYVKNLVLEDIAVSIGSMGAVQFQGEMGTAPGDTRYDRQRRKARSDADTLMERAVDYIEANPETFPTYNAKDNIRKRISGKGGVIL